VLRDFVSFLRALWHEWKLLLTGGSVVAIIALVNLFSGKSVPQSINWLATGLTFMLEAFFSWRREWINGGSGFVEIDFKSLPQIFEGRTKPQAKALIRHLLGGRIKVTGVLEEIQEAAGSPVFPSTLQLRFERTVIVVDVYPWNRSFTGANVLSRGTVLTVSGRIRELTPSVVFLSSCELIAVTAPPVSSQ
jgi:hypothetical protein